MSEIIIETAPGTKLKINNLYDIPLLTAQLQRDGVLFDIRDFPNLKRELDKRGIMDREATEEAWNKITQYNDEILKMQMVKKNRTPMPLPRCIKTTPYLDQWGGIYLFLSRQFVGNWDIMGCGKSFMALCAAGFLKEHGIVEKILIICPNHVKLVWRDEIIKHTTFDFKIIGNGTKDVLFDLGTFINQDILVIHYDCLLNQEIFNELVKMKFDLVILDEAHYIKNISAKRTKKTISLIEGLKRFTPLSSSIIERAKINVNNKEKVFVWCLTGTPVSERPDNAFTLLKILDPDLKISHWQFEQFFNIYIKIPVKGYKIRKLVGFKNVEHLGSFFELFSIRRRREELQGMPEKIISDRILTLSDRQFDIYQSIRSGVIEELKRFGRKINISRLENILLRLHQVVNHPKILGLDGPSVKHEEILFLLDEILSSNGQVIIWCIFRRGAELLLETLRKNDIKAELLYGGVDIKEMDRIQKDFEAGKVNVIIASIKKMGTGVDFLKKARTAIYLDLPFSFVEYVQSQDRLIRRGIASPALLIRLIINNTIDEVIRSILARKEQIFKNMIEPDRDQIEALREDSEVSVDEVIQGI